jgi:integrase
MMAPARTGKTGGAFQFDRVFAGVGRIKRSSGTDKVKEFRKRDALLTKLFETSALAVLRAFKAGQITIEAIVEADRGTNVLTSMDQLAEIAPLPQAIAAALLRMGDSAATRDRYARSLAKLLREVPALSVGRVGDLASVDWYRLEQSWTASSADWNHVRRAVSRFLTVHLGDKFHPFRRRVVVLIPQRKESPRTPDQSAEQFLRMVDTMPLPAQPCFMALALTGMRIGEYVAADRASLRDETESVTIRGKTGDGVVYLTTAGYQVCKAAIPCPLGPAPRPGQRTGDTLRYQRMRRLFAQAQAETGVSGLTLHDIRHLFGQTAAQANVPTVETQAQLRHIDPRMTRRYEMPMQARRAAEAVAERLGVVSAAPNKPRKHA